MTSMPDGIVASDLSVKSGLAALTQKSALFAAGAVAGKVVGLVMLPVLTRLLTPAALGSLDVLMALQTDITVALLLGLDVAALRLYFDQPDRAAQGRLVASWYVLAFGISVTASFVLVLCSGAISVALFSTDHLQPAVLAVAIALVGGTVQVVVLTILRAGGRAGWYATISGGALLLYAVLAVVLLRTWRADASAVMAAWASALVGSAVAGTILLRRQVIGRPSRKACRALLRLGLPLAPAVVATLASDSLIRIILLGSAGAEQVAYFSVGNRFASVAALSLVVLQLVWVPRVYELGTTPAARARIGAEAVWIVALVCVAVLVVAAGAREVVEVVAGSAYLPALPALGFSLVAVVGAAVYLVASMPSALARRTEDLGLATGVAAVAALAGTVLLAPVWQATGTAAAAAAGQVIAFAIVGWLGARRMAVATEWVRLVGMGAATCVATLVLVSEAALPVRLAVTAAGLAVIGSSVPLRRGLRAVGELLDR